MEIESAIRRRLLADPTVTGYVGDRVHLYRLTDRVDPFGTRAVVLYPGPGWADTDRYEGSSSEYPTVVVDCWADCTRTDDGEIARIDRVQAAKSVWRSVHRVLHNPARGQVWGAVGSNPGVLVDSSSLWFHPVHMEGTVARTGLPLGDAAVVTATYALHTALLVA